MVLTMMLVEEAAAGLEAMLAEIIIAAEAVAHHTYQDIRDALTAILDIYFRIRKCSRGARK